MHGWRRLLLRLFGARIGEGVHVYPSVSIWAPWNLELHEQAGIGPGVKLYSQGVISIGARTVVSQGTHLCAGTHDFNEEGFPLVIAPITIGDDVWIAADSFVHPNIIIGNGCVIGARSVVQKHMPAWTICTGHPCEPIKPRPPKMPIVRMMRSSTTVDFGENR